jgi:hypothetical protein
MIPMGYSSPLLEQLILTKPPLVCFFGLNPLPHCFLLMHYYHISNYLVKYSYTRKVQMFHTAVQNKLKMICMKCEKQRSDLNVMFFVHTFSKKNVIYFL